MRYAPRVPALLALMSIALVPAPGQAQASGLLNGTGYAVLGGTAGLLATANAECEGGFICIPGETVVATTIGLVAGMAAGLALTSSANRSAEEARPVGGAHMGALVVGTILGGATLGMIGGAMLPGDGEEVVFLGGFIGAGWGVYKLTSTWGELTDSDGRRLVFTPGAMVHGRPGLLVTARF
jgi:hypothetical protein